MLNGTMFVVVGAMQDTIQSAHRFLTAECGVGRVKTMSRRREDRIVERLGRDARRSLGLLLMFLASCAGPRVEVPTDGAQVGMASWYGPKFHGRPTASGEVFNMYQLTAAHRTLPLDTWVYVTNLENGRSIQVRVNDRGPFVRGRIIDLSYAAARAIDMVRDGVVRVRVFPLGTRPDMIARPDGRRPDSRTHPVARPPAYTLQVGSFADKQNAIALKGRLASLTSQAYISKVEVGGETFYRVCIGSYSSREAATRAAIKVADHGFTVILIGPD